MQDGYRMYRRMLDQQALVELVYKLWFRKDTHGEYEITMMCGENEGEWKEEVIKYARRVGVELKETRGCILVF